MDGLLKKLTRIEEGMVGFALLGLAALTAFETVLRYSISYTFSWFGEFANYTMIFCAYLGASIGVKHGALFSMEALVEYLPDRASHALKAAAYALSGFICLLFVYYGAVQIVKTRAFGVRSPAMQLPMYIPYLPIPVFSATMGFRFFVLSFRHLRCFVNNEPFERIRRK
jgi:C4-dicarboxylate transporter DctQ subunit